MRIYVCSPYRAIDEVSIYVNVEFAKECCRAIFDAGHDPYAPHLFFTQFCDDGKDNERARCMEAAKRELLLCDGLMVFGDAWSEGMMQEVAFADDNGVPVYQALRENLAPHVFNAVCLFMARSELRMREQVEDLRRRYDEHKGPNMREWRDERNFLWGELPWREFS